MARARSNPQVILRPQDLVVLLRLSLEPCNPTVAESAAVSQMWRTSCPVTTLIMLFVLRGQLPL